MGTTSTAIATLTLLALIAPACASDDGVAEPLDNTTTVATVDRSDPAGVLATDVAPSDVSTTVPTGGWIGDEPSFAGGSAAGADDSVTFSEDAAEEEAMEEADRDASFDEAAPAEAAVVEPDFPDEEPCVDCDVADDSPLRAGSVDDNDDFDGFLEYLDRLDGIGIERREFDPTGRSIVTVRRDDGRPTAGAVVVAEADGLSATLRTTADGTVRFHPAAYGMAVDAEISYTVQVPDAEAIVAPAGTDVELNDLTGAIDAVTPVPLDVLFLLDATGSMGDEIDRLKTTIDTVAERITALDPAPDVRFAMTLYRDEGDAFVVATYDFTGDVEEFQAALEEVVADGGGDYPEALDEGLAAAFSEPTWRRPGDAVQLVFVVADAPPQVARQVEVPYTDSIRTAIERGVKIFPIASSESDDQAEAVFRQLAQATGAPFVFLSNGAAGASVGESTDIASTDYEELALDELIVRLVAEELADLGADGEVTVPTTISPPATNPEGQ